VFHKYTDPGGSLADWTRHVDGDWIWYCPKCAEVVLLIEEKKENAREKAWTVTRRMATRHEDRPWAWRVIFHEDGDFTVIGARSEEKHDSFGNTRISEERLIAWIEKVFSQHYELRGHAR
jgi:hypothetical protein